MSKIDAKLDDVYYFLKKYQTDNGYPPSVREICAKLKIKSTATAYYYLEKLEERGIISKRSNKNRALTLTKEEDNVPFLSIPVVGTVTAGTPILAVENLDGYYPISTEFATSSDLFILKVKGDSMIEAGIFNGDKLICKKTSEAKNGDIVVALIDDSATVKRFFKYPDKIILHPENSALSDIVLDDVAILGKATGLLRKF